MTNNGSNNPRPLQAASDQPEGGPRPRIGGQLVSRNVRIRNRRTSVRLEPEMWEALHEVATLENCSVNDLCAAVEDLRDPAASFTGALRVFLMEYFRNAAKSSRPANLIQKKTGDKDIKGR